MQHVDALNRYPIVTIEADDITARIRKAQRDDAKVQNIFDYFQNGSNNGYVMCNGLQYRFANGDDLLVVPTYIFAVIDALTKFTWLYPTKSTTSREVIHRLDKQKHIFGNPVRIISDRGTAFTSQEFQDYCEREKIQHHGITTSLPRANAQIERVNRMLYQFWRRCPFKILKIVPAHKYGSTSSKLNV